MLSDEVKFSTSTGWPVPEYFIIGPLVTRENTSVDTNGRVVNITRSEITLYECARCYAIVQNQYSHTQWHKSNDEWG